MARNSYLKRLSYPNKAGMFFRRGKGNQTNFKNLSVYEIQRKPFKLHKLGNLICCVWILLNSARIREDKLLCHNLLLVISVLNANIYIQERVNIRS